MDIGEAMALTNSNNNWMNNPFMYLIWLAFFGGDGRARRRGQNRPRRICRADRAGGPRGKRRRTGARQC